MNYNEKKVNEKTEEKRNLIRQNYLSSQTNYVLCIDVTEIGKNYSLFCVLDLAARNIVGHCFLDSDITVLHVVDTLRIVLKDRDFLPEVQIVHSDRGSLFKNQVYYDFLEEHHIQISRGSAKAHDNQVIERTFGTLKSIMKRRIKVDPKNKDISLNHFSNFAEKAQFIKEIIEFYNNRPHRSLCNMTPSQMEEALFCQRESTNIIDNQLVPFLTKNDQGAVAKQIEAFKQVVIHDYLESYIGNPRGFFERFTKETMGHLNTIIKQNYTLYQQNLDLKKQMNFVESELQFAKEERLLKAERALKRKNTITQKMRDSVDEEEFKTILEIVKQNHFVASRRKTALLLLYVTGLRVSNLLKFEIKHIQELLDKGETNIPLIKKGNKRHHILLSDKSRKWLQQYSKNFTLLMFDKDRDSYFFTTQSRLDKPINRSSFDHELNQILAKASEKFSKHLRTHSFRASMITDFLKSTPIDIVKEIVGHKDIGTTLQYKRGGIDAIQMKSVLKKLDFDRSIL